MKDYAYYVYMVASRTRTLYIGVTGNLRQRIYQHRLREIDGFTARYACDRLVWFERHSDIKLAITREKQLKGLLRSKKIALIEEQNRTWADLSLVWDTAFESFEGEQQVLRCAQDDNCGADSAGARPAADHPRPGRARLSSRVNTKLAPKQVSS